MVRTARAAAKAASRKGRCPAPACTTGALPAGRWRIMASEGSTATTGWSAGRTIRCPRRRSPPSPHSPPDPGIRAPVASMPAADRVVELAHIPRQAFRAARVAAAPAREWGGARGRYAMLPTSEIRAVGLVLDDLHLELRGVLEQRRLRARGVECVRAANRFPALVQHRPVRGGDVVD